MDENATEPRRLPPLGAGRRPAGAALLRLLDDPRAPRICLVTGPPGSGRSHLLGWLATACAHPAAPARQRPDAAVSLAGATVDLAVWTLAARLGLHARTPGDLTAALAAAKRPVLLFLRDLDRALHPEELAARLLDPLLALPQVRAVVDTAPGLSIAGGLSNAAGLPNAAADAAVMDLADPAWTDAARFTAWYERRRGDSPVGAEHLGTNAGLALLASRTPGGTPLPAEPRLGAIALAAAWYRRLPEDSRTALAVLAAAARPLTAEEWSLLAGPESVAATTSLLPEDGTDLRDWTGGAGGTWWLAPGPLRDLATAAGATDPAELARTVAGSVPRTAAGTPDLRAADPARLGLLLGQALAAGFADGLLDDPVLVARADQRAVAAAFAARPDARLLPAWRAAGPALLREPSAASREHLLLMRLTDGPSTANPGAGPADAGWSTAWARWGAGGEPPTAAAALGRGPYEGSLLAADAAGTVRVLDPASGSDRGAPFPAGCPGEPAQLSCFPDGTVLALDTAGRLHTLAGEGVPFPADAAPTALCHLPALGEAGGAVRWFGPGEHAAEQLHEGPVTALGAVLLPADEDAPAGTVLLVSGGADGRVRAWCPGTPPLPEPVAERPSPVAALALAMTGEGLFLAVAWADGAVRVGPVDGRSSAVDLALGAPVRALVPVGPGAFVLALPDGLVRIALSASAPS
ncbi:hypothetical protein ACWGB8_11735 [Kitasatospora sp. NPDC054939]